MAVQPPPLPVETPLVETNRQMNWFWVQYFTARDQRIEASADTVVDARLSAQAASIGATPLSIGTSAGLFRVSVMANITRAATVSSSLAVTIAWTQDGVAKSKAYPAITGNTTATYLAESAPVRIDPNTSLTYATTYASVGATTMQYSLEVAVERVA